MTANQTISCQNFRKIVIVYTQISITSFHNFMTIDYLDTQRCFSFPQMSKLLPECLQTSRRRNEFTVRWNQKKSTIYLLDLFKKKVEFYHVFWNNFDLQKFFSFNFILYLYSGGKCTVIFWFKYCPKNYNALFSSNL